MGLIKVKILPFYTSGINQSPCLVSIYIDAKIVWCARSDSIAVFEAHKPCMVSFLIYNAGVSDRLPFNNDLVITGILQPGKQYEMIQAEDSYEFMEIITE